MSLMKFRKRSTGVISLFYRGTGTAKDLTTEVGREAKDLNLHLMYYDSNI